MNLKIVKGIGKGYIIIILEIYMMENGKMIKKKEEKHFLIIMVNIEEINIKENLKML